MANLETFGLMTIYYKVGPYQSQVEFLTPYKYALPGLLHPTYRGPISPHL